MNKELQEGVLLRCRRIADWLGVRRALNSMFEGFSRLRFKANLARGCLGLDRVKASTEITAVVLTVDPSHLFDKCMAAIGEQTIQPAHTIVVKNVTPFSRACQDGLDQVKTPYYLSIDEDMILHPHCFEHLYGMIHADSDCAEAVARLEDPLQGSIVGIHMYRSEAVRRIGFHPLVGEKGCERHMWHELTRAGHTRIVSPLTEGKHRPEYLPQDAFWKYKFAAEKTRYYPDERPTVREMVDQIASYWQRTHSDLALYAWAGLFDGLQSEDVGRQLDYTGRSEYPVFLRVQEGLARRESDQRNAECRG